MLSLVGPEPGFRKLPPPANEIHHVRQCVAWSIPGIGGLIASRDPKAPRNPKAREGVAPGALGGRAAGVVARHSLRAGGVWRQPPQRLATLERTSQLLSIRFKVRLLHISVAAWAVPGSMTGISCVAVMRRGTGMEMNHENDALQRLLQRVISPGKQQSGSGCASHPGRAWRREVPLRPRPVQPAATAASGPAGRSGPNGRQPWRRVGHCGGAAAAGEAGVPMGGALWRVGLAAVQRRRRRLGVLLAQQRQRADVEDGGVGRDDTVAASGRERRPLRGGN